MFSQLFFVAATFSAAPNFLLTIKKSKKPSENIALRLGSSDFTEQLRFSPEEQTNIDQSNQIRRSRFAHAGLQAQNSTGSSEHWKESAVESLHSSGLPSP